MLSKLLAAFLTLFAATSHAPTPQPTPIPTFTPTPPPIIYFPDVPFTPQAPFGDWSDPKEQDGCEEASALMAISWANNQSLTPRQSLSQILASSQYQSQNWGEFRDTSAADTTTRIIHGFFSYPHAETKTIFSPNQIISELAQGHLVIAPMDGQKLGNPYFTSPGPERHMLVIRGFDRLKNQFITNDPGTRRGENYRYPKEVLFSAIRDYPTGYHVPIVSITKNIIVVRPPD